MESSENIADPTAEEFDDELEVGNHPALLDALNLVMSQLEEPPFKVRRFDVQLLSGGEVTYRAWDFDTDDYEGGVLNLGE